MKSTKIKDSDVKMLMDGGAGIYLLGGVNAVVKLNKTESRTAVAYDNTTPVPVTKDKINYRGYVRWGVLDNLPQLVTEKAEKSEVPAKFVLSNRKPTSGIAASCSPKASWMLRWTKGTTMNRPHMP